MMQYILGIAALYLVLIALLSFAAYRAMFHPLFRSLEFSRDRGLERGEFKREFVNLPWEGFHVESPHGYRIEGSVLASGLKDAPTALFVHGISWTRFGMYKYMASFFARGWNVAAIDLANHGATKAPKIYGPSYGFYEKRDVAAAVKAIHGMFPDTRLLGLVGESLGAATVLQYASLPVDPSSMPIAFVIADFSFTSAAKELDAQLIWLKLPKFIRANVCFVVSFFSKAMRGFRLEEASPENSCRHFDVPVLFVHGKEDTYVPTRMSIEMYNVRRNYGKPGTELLLIPDARHAKSYMTDPLLWEAKVFGFIERYAFGTRRQG